MLKEQHFYIAVSKYLFHHSELGIVTAEEPIRVEDAAEYDLSPIILYGLTVPKLSISWLTYSLYSEPKDLIEVLKEGWANANGLRGLPDILKVSKKLPEACPTLRNSLFRLGVVLATAEKTDKSFPASLRTAQESSRHFIGSLNQKEQEGYYGDIEKLCSYAQADHEFRMRLHQMDLSGQKLQLYLEWSALPVRNCPERNTKNCEWERGSWLFSWGNSLPPERHGSRAFCRYEEETRVWLYNKDVGHIKKRVDYDSVKSLLKCLPFKPVYIASQIGITLKKLNWYLSGKDVLSNEEENNLIELINLEYDEDYLEFRPSGPYVLYLNDLKAMDTVFNAITFGGDSRPFEIIPTTDSYKDKELRFFVINQYGYAGEMSIIMAPLESELVSKLPEVLCNYVGEVKVLDGIYNQIAMICKTQSASPKADAKRIKSLILEYGYWWLSANRY